MPAASKMLLSLVLVCAAFSNALAATVERDDSGSEQALFNGKEYLIDPIRTAMMASIRTSWEQGTAAQGILETDYPEYTVFGASPWASNHGTIPVSALQFALSAVVRQSPDGRLSQEINDAEDGAALDGASAGIPVLLGSYTQTDRADYWLNAAAAQLNFILNEAPRTSTGAISHRIDSKQYWADGVFMGFPFIAAYGAVTKNQTLLQIAYEQCSLYRDALLVPGPTGPLWAHIYSDDTKSFVDPGTWASGNAWAALGMLRVAVTISKSAYPDAGAETALVSWTKEILDDILPAITSENLLPDYVANGSTFADASSSAALASVAYRAATLYPHIFGANYTTAAGVLRDQIIYNLEYGYNGGANYSGLGTLGVMAPVVNPVNEGAIGTLSTEAQSFGLMMFAAWKAWAFQY